jgi:hypothetical protein
MAAQLGLKENWRQFSLLVLINAFVKDGEISRPGSWRAQHPIIYAVKQSGQVSFNLYPFTLLVLPGKKTLWSEAIPEHLPGNTSFLLPGGSAAPCGES